MEFLDGEVCKDNKVYDCLIVGSGAASYNAAIHLYEKGIRNFAIIAERRTAGTSRNTGSDKQTYYKVACAGVEKDSPRAMAETFFSGGAMDGDLALCEASHSLQEFFHLVSIGVDFPHNSYGEFIGYKTDNDPLQRASSIGPYTSKLMTEKLENAVMARGIDLLDETRVIKILTDKNSGRSFGLLCLKGEKIFCVYYSKNIIFATGGTPGLYENTVYPPSQFGSGGILAREGVVFANITEWQYGIGSIKFRWNLSGSFQQVIPRYLSMDEHGVCSEFLSGYFSSVKNLCRSIFLKGYQWPFDPAKIVNEGSSLIDLAIYIEKHIKGRRIFLDFTSNPDGMVLGEIDETALDYLTKSGALSETPLERLLELNPDAYDLYKANGIDLAKEYLEIDVLPQHHNGGAEVNIWWETSVKHLFAIGECAGTHGIHRPGGSALNSGQVGGFRAASFISGYALKDDAFYSTDALEAMAAVNLAEFEAECTGRDTGIYGAWENPGNAVQGSIASAAALLKELQKINTSCAAFVRSREELEKRAGDLEALSKNKFKPGESLMDFFRFKEILLFSRFLHNGILSYIYAGGKSRGSCLILDSMDDIESCSGGVDIDTVHRSSIFNTSFLPAENRVIATQRKVRQIPDSDTWFEKTWREYREGAIYKKNMLHTE